MTKIKNREIPALEKIGNNVIVVNPYIYYRCPDCGKEMVCEYNFDDSQNYIICLKCKKVFVLILKEVKKQFREK